MKNFLKIKTILTLSLIFATTYASVNVTNLNQQWQLELIRAPDPHKQLLNKKLSTILPSTLHLDLLKHQKIQDPFYRNNYNTLKWVSQCEVNYTKKFKVIETDLNRAIEIVFHGIDTYAKVTINGHQILIVNNAFRKYSARVQKFLNNGENVLQVSFEPAQKYDIAGQSSNNMPFKYAQTRKACYQYSWDWAPEIVTMGIWKDVQLHVYDEIKIDYVWARNRLVSKQKATINFATKFILNLFKSQKLAEGHTLSVHLNDKKLSEVKINEDSAYIDVHIQNPKLWWPNGIGEPYVYDFLVKLNKNGKTIEQKKVPYGIRTVELNLKQRQFKVLINGSPVYAKGSNYVPLDMLYPRITNKYFQNNNTYTIQKLISDAVSSNFNMIRIWGGGQYESDEYLELASRKGIMIFYDFMFSDSIYPSTPSFLENVEEEVKQQIRRARNYPCLALWSGNNEILQGIQDWGWGNQAYRNDYHLLFEKLIPQIVKIQSPQISYIASSPIYGVGNYGFERGGDVHYWGVWAGGSNFESYEGAVGSFNSQFGTQGLPVWHTIKRFTKEDQRSYTSQAFRVHERHNSQFNTLKNYMTIYMKESKNFQNQAYLSGVLQAFAMEIAIRAQRTSKPKSYGTLYWQMNDAWPAISWSSIDYYGRWKPLQYMVKRIYPDISIFGLENGQIMAVNDKLYPVEVQIKVIKTYFNGTIVSEEQKKTTLPADSSSKVHQVSPPQTQSQKNSIVLYTQISYKNTVQMSNTKYFTAFKNLNLPKALLQVSYKPDSNQITLKSSQLIKNLFIDHKQHYVQFTDNYFDLLPNSPVTVTILNGAQLGSIQQGLKYNSIRQASINGEELQVTFN